MTVASEHRRSPPWILVSLAHLMLAAGVIRATRWYLGFENVLSPANQGTWTPIVAAQISLVVLGFAFSEERILNRLGFFFVGILAAITLTVWAHSLFVDFGRALPWRVLGLFVLAVATAFVVWSYPLQWIGCVFQWVIVLVTLTLLRVAGYRFARTMACESST
jgi:hypothetical protein